MESNRVDDLSSFLAIDCTRGVSLDIRSHAGTDSRIQHNA